jgi:hypothetical protein
VILFWRKARFAPVEEGIPTGLEKWLKRVTEGDTGLSRVTVYKNVGRPTNDSKKWEEALWNVTNYCCRFFFC